MAIVLYGSIVYVHLQYLRTRYISVLLVIIESAVPALGYQLSFDVADNDVIRALAAANGSVDSAFATATKDVRVSIPDHMDPARKSSD